MNLSIRCNRIVKELLVRCAAVVLCVFLVCVTGCGIDEYIYLYPPSWGGNDPTDTTDAERKFFEFNTRDFLNIEAADEYYTGYEVYYRVYNKSSVRDADRSQINTYNSNDTTKAMAFNYVSNTKKFRRLIRVQDDLNAPVSGAFIPRSASDRTITIRLHEEGAYAPGIWIDGAPWYQIPAESVLWAPKRSIQEGGSFTDRSLIEFTFDNFTVNNPTDYDITVSDNGSETEVYVLAYAFAVGLDNSYRSIYSEALYLGSITILE